MSISQQPFGEPWIAAYFDEVDRMNPDGLAAWYAEDGRFRFGNSAPVIGKSAIAEVLRGFYGSIASMSHRKTGCWVDGDSGVWEAEVTFGLLDGRSITIPAVSILRTAGGKVTDFRLVMDAAPLFASPSS